MADRQITITLAPVEVETLRRYVEGMRHMPTTDDSAMALIERRAGSWADRMVNLATSAVDTAQRRSGA